MTSRVTREDITRIDALLAQFESSVGGSHLTICEAAGAIARAGGSGRPEVALTATQDGRRMDDILWTPWQWLVAVAVEAEGHNNWRLIARIAWFAQFWSEQVLSGPDRGEAVGTDLGEAPDGVRAELATLTLTALSTVRPDSVVTRDATGTVVTAGVVAEVCAQELARGADRGVPVSAAALALAREPGGTPYGPASGAVPGVPQLVPDASAGAGPSSVVPGAGTRGSMVGDGALASLGLLFARDSSTAERVQAVRDLATAARSRLSAAASAAEDGRDVLAERSAQILSELAGRLPIRTTDTLRSLFGEDPEVQSQHVITEAGRLAGLVWTAAAAVPGPPPVVQAIKVVVHSAIEIRMIGELYAIHADEANREASWLGAVLLSWATGQPVAPGGSAAPTTAALIAKIQGSTEELIGSQSRGAIVASRGREGIDVMVRAGARMQRRMRLHPSSWVQPSSQSTGAVVREATGKLAADKLAGIVPKRLVSLARDRLAPASPPLPGQPELPADPREALAWAWALHRQAAAAASAVPPSDLIAARLTAALSAQERHLQTLGSRLGKLGPSGQTQRDGGGGSDAGHLVWQADGAIDVVEETGARSRRLPSWSTRRRAALVYLIAALVASVVPAVGLLGSSGFGTLALLATQCIALPWLSLAAGAIAIGPLFRPWLGGPVPRHPIIGTWIVFAVHAGTAVAAAVVGTFT